MEPAREAGGTDTAAADRLEVLVDVSLPSLSPRGSLCSDNFSLLSGVSELH